MAQSGRILRLNPRNPSREGIRDILDELRGGGIMAFPTDTVYGLGGLLEPRVYRGLFRIKRRSSSKPIGVFVPSSRFLAKLGAAVPGYSKKLMRDLWPGPLTLVFNLKGNELKAFFPKGTVGIRIPGEKWLLNLLKHLESPLLQTSANISGKGEVRSPRGMQRVFGSKVSLIVDTGQRKPGRPSTVVDVTGMEPILLREGAISRITLERILERKIRHA